MPVKKDVCRNFQRGSCQYGQRCKFLHVTSSQQQQRPNNVFSYQQQQQQQKPSNPYGFGVQNNPQPKGAGDFGSKPNQHKPFQNSWTRSSSTPNANNTSESQSQTTNHKCTDRESCRRVAVEDFQHERPLWRLTCYGHWKNAPCDIVGDISYEELRMAAYDDAKRGLSLQTIVDRERNLVNSKVIEFENLCKSGPVPQNSTPANQTFPGTAPNAFAQSAQAPNAFAQSAQAPNAFAQSAQAPNAFAQSAQAPNAFAQSAQAPNAFAQSAQAPNAFAQSAQAPNAFAQNAQAPNAFAQNAQVPNAFAQKAQGPNAFSQNAQVPNAFAQNAQVPNAFSQNAQVPNAFAQNAQGPNAFSQNAQNGAPTSVSSFSQLGASLNGQRPSAPLSNAFSQKNSFGVSSQTSSAFGTSNLSSQSQGSPFATAPFSNTSFTSNPITTSTGSNGPSSTGFQQANSTQSDVPSSVDASVWLKNSWAPGEIPEEAPPDTFCC
ncbi:zinc finger CCCH domain-containing protein 16 isoform X2 [Cannabis sativa]|nr:zinc finger CCCH domain-containing protein 16 isoform X2 [Cannabis sativa]XP_060963132.1 zinc finger CCCH domain-containing protein 16 isoform X2 [Cannabis sativa]